MKSKDLCKQYGFNQTQFENFLRKQQFKYTDWFNGIAVNDSDVEEIVSAFKEKLEMDKMLEEQARIDEIRKPEEDRKKKRALAEMLITSGFTFDGYKITKYSGYISGDDCVTLPRDTFWGNNKVEDNLCGALVKIRRQALKELKEAAYDLGCNAVIGVDFDYLTMDPQHASALNGTVTVYEPYVICVTANGNAVVIEKED
jgi:uncharacterized protein YbjQ (UPF0145 family)